MSAFRLGLGTDPGPGVGGVEAGGDRPVTSSAPDDADGGHDADGDDQADDDGRADLHDAHGVGTPDETTTITAMIDPSTVSPR